MSASVLTTGVAILRAAGYRTAAAVGYEALDRAKLAGQQIGDDLRRTAQQLKRAAARGLGPPERSAVFPVERLPELTDEDEPFVEAGPVHPRRVLTIGCWWLTREIELGNTAVSDVSETPSGAQLCLPVSKTDICALGTVRQHNCACGRRSGGPQLVPRALCPACALLDQAAFARATFPELGDNAPLTPTRAGDFPAKTAVVATIRAAAQRLSLPVKTPSGAEAWGGHALRRGGAQFLARAGVPIPLIQAMARHSSAAIFGYIENEHVHNVKNIAALAAGWAAAPATPSGVSATDVRLTELAEQIQALQALIAQRSVTPAVAVAKQAQTQHAAGAPDYVLSLRAHGKVHRKDPYMEGVTRCGWAWAKCGLATPAADTAGASLCLVCFVRGSTAPTPRPGDISSSASESGTDSSSSDCP